MELIRDAFSFLGGICIGVILGIFLCVISIATDNAIILLDGKCTETAIVGESPNRYETCIKWEKQP